MTSKFATRAAAIALPLAATGVLVAPAHADVKTAPAPQHHGSSCGVRTSERGFSAGVEELTTGTLNCVVRGTRDVLSGLNRAVSQDRDDYQG